MTTSEIKELTPKELSARIAGHRQEIFHFRLQQQAGQLEKPHLLRIARREIARLQTYIKQKAQ
jgi:large subunit ribosomal protein L29